MSGFPDGSVGLPETPAGEAPPVPENVNAAPSDLGTFTSPGQPAISPTAQMAFGQALTYGLPGLGIGLLDTLGQSLHIFKDSSVPDFMKQYTGSDEGSFGDFYARNQQPLRTGGEIVGMLVPGLAAMKILKTVKLAREAGQLGEILQNSRALDVILGNSAELSGLEAKLAQETITGSDSMGVWAGRSLAIPAITSAKRGYYAARALDAARTTIAFELGNRAAFNSSSTFYPADYTLTDQLQWAGINIAGGVGLDFVAARYAIRGIMQNALAGSARQAAEYGTIAPTAANSSFSSTISDTIFRPNDRGIGVTQYAALQADLKNTTSLSSIPTLQTNLAQDNINIKAVLTKQLGLMAYDTHPVIPRTTLSPDQLQLSLKALDQNPTSFLWAKKLGNVPADGASEFYGKVDNLLDKAQRKFYVDNFLANSETDLDKQTALFAKAQATFAPIQDAATEIHYVIENDGRYSVYRNRADNFLDQHGFSDIKRQSYSTPALDANGQNVLLKNTKLIGKADNQIILHDNFRAEISAGATPNDFSLLYAMGSKLIKEWEPVTGQQFILTPQLPWRTIEGTVALAEARPEAKNLIKFGGGFASLDDAKFNVLNQKFQEFQALMPITARQPLSGVALRVASLKANYTPAQVLQRLNLPEPIGTTPSPLIETFAHARLQNMNSLDQMFPLTRVGLQPPTYTQMDLLQAHLRETMGIADNSKQIPIAGSLLKQNDTRPVFVAATSTPSLSRNDAMIGGLVQAKRAIQLERLANINPQQAPLVSEVIAKTVTASEQGSGLSGAAEQARAVQTLHDGMVAGSGQVVYQDRINEQFPTLKAAQLVVQNVGKIIDDYVGKLFTNVGITSKVADILSPKNRADLLDFNRIEQSYRHGWDVGKIEPAVNGKGSIFALKPDSKINAQLINYHFPSSEPTEITHLPDMSTTALKNGYSPLIVSNNSANLVSAISATSVQSGRENNALRMALGSNPVQLRDFHLPTPELSRNGTWFVRNDTGNVIATYTGDLESSNRLRALRAAETLNKNTNSTHIAVPLDAVQRDHAIMDENFFDVIDYSDQILKSGKGITGGLARTEVDTGDATLKAMVHSLQQQYLNIGIRANAAIFEPELNYARQAAQMAPRDNLGGLNIFDRYIATMFGQTPTSGKGPVSSAYNGLEGGLDRALSWLNAYHTELSSNTENTIAAKTMRVLLRKQSSEEEFRQFSANLPEWSPFRDASQWAESTFREKLPWTSRPIMSKLSRLSSTMSLRFLDAGTAINNFAGLLTNAPAVVYGLRKLPSENQEQWVARTAAWGTNYVNGISTFSPMKAMNTAIRAYWSGELAPAMADAAAHGYFNPEYSALAQALTIKSAAGQKLDNFIAAGSYMADHSEILSRKLAWGMGYKIGKDLHGFTDERNSYIFANNFVNDMIGNYNPSNKPAMFQGAIGLPLGAFQTYMFNFYRRMYGYVERGDRAALIAQYAAQASLFGAKSVPGYGLWNNLMQSNQDGSDNFDSRINRGQNAVVGDLLLNGTLANIPRIFGSSDGLAFNTRGSVDMTSLPPTIADWQRAPPIQFLASVAAGIQDTLNNVFSVGPTTRQNQEEILARMSTNRAFRSIMEMAAGVKVNQRSSLVDNGTRDAIHIAAALLGTQPQSTRAMADSYSRERSVQLSQEALRATLDDKTRSLFRSGNFDVSDLQSLIEGYRKSGGNPAYLGSWFRNTFTTAMTPAAYAKMEELGRSGKLLEFENMLSAIQQNQNPPK